MLSKSNEAHVPSQSRVRQTDKVKERTAQAENGRSRALKMRQERALAQSRRPLPNQLINGDEQTLPRWAGSFTKGLPHNQFGEAELGKYETLLESIKSGRHVDFEKLARGSGRTFVNPQAALSLHFEGGDACSFTCAPPPSFTSAEAAAEMVELYWQALARDIPFLEYDRSPLIERVAVELGQLKRFSGPKQSGQVTFQTVFRGNTLGDLTGPFVSQFLWKPVPCGSGKMEQRYRTPAAGSDFLNTYSEWLQQQSGTPPWREYRWRQEPQYITTGRDLAEYVHFDFLYQAFLNAALIIQNHGPESLLNSTSYLSNTNPYKYSKTQTGFVTFGLANVVDWLGRITTACMKAAWYQKWLVHRRLRPEEFGGRVHQQQTAHTTHFIDTELSDSLALEETFRRQGNYLLSQSYPEGCPLHPAYPSGHATVSGGCATLLKAFFDESIVVPDCVIPSTDGLSLHPYEGSALTLKGEVEKLAFNIAMGRNFAGIHYRSDASAGIRLGEEVATSVLEDLVNTFNEDFGGFRFTRFDGSVVTIRRIT